MTLGNSRKELENLVKEDIEKTFNYSKIASGKIEELCENVASLSKKSIPEELAKENGILQSSLNSKTVEIENLFMQNKSLENTLRICNEMQEETKEGYRLHLHKIVEIQNNMERKMKDMVDSLSNVNQEEQNSLQRDQGKKDKVLFGTLEDLINGLHGEFSEMKDIFVRNSKGEIDRDEQSKVLVDCSIYKEKLDLARAENEKNELELKRLRKSIDRIKGKYAPTRNTKCEG